MGAQIFGDWERPIGDGRGNNHFQRRLHLTSSRGSIYTSCSIFPAFTITAQNHDTSFLLVPQLMVCRVRKASLPAAFAGARHWSGAFPRDQGPRGRRTQSCRRSLSRQLNFSSTSRGEPARDVFPSKKTSPSSPQLSVPRIPPPKNDFMKRLPPIPRSAKPVHRHPGRWRRLTPFGTLADQTRGRLPLRVSLGTASDCHPWHKTLHIMPPRDRNATFPLPNSLNRP
jgi:hypothetical protein